MELFLWLAHLSFDEIDNPLGLRHGVVLGQSADDHARAIEQNDGRSDAFALGIGDDLRLSVDVDMRHRAERGSKVNSNYFSSSHMWVRLSAGGETSICSLRNCNFHASARGQS